MTDFAPLIGRLASGACTTADLAALAKAAAAAGHCRQTWLKAYPRGRRGRPCKSKGRFGETALTGFYARCLNVGFLLHKAHKLPREEAFQIMVENLKIVPGAEEKCADAAAAEQLAAAFFRTGRSDLNKVALAMRKDDREHELAVAIADQIRPEKNVIDRFI